MTTVYLRTKPDDIADGVVDATAISTSSEFISEWLSTYTDDGTSVHYIDILVGSPDTVHEQTKYAVEAIRMLPDMYRFLHAFNNPEKPDDVDEIPLDVMKTIHRTITEMKTTWEALTDNNPVYKLLLPLYDFEKAVNSFSDMYWWVCEFSLENPDYSEIRDVKTSIKHRILMKMCKLNNLNAVKWMYSLGGIDLHEAYDAVLSIALQFGTCDLVQWIVTEGGFDIHYHYDHIFHTACIYGNLEVAKFVFYFDDVNIDIHIDQDETFLEVCENGHLEVAQWLVSLGGVVIHTWEDSPYINAVKNGHIHVADWIRSLDPAYYE
jgi:hypothetical protein